MDFSKALCPTVRQFLTVYLSAHSNDPGIADDTFFETRKERERKVGTDFREQSPLAYIGPSCGNGCRTAFAYTSFSGTGPFTNHVVGDISRRSAQGFL